MALINCKVELKLKSTKYCVLSVADNENNVNEDANANNIIFTIKDTKLYVPVVTLSARDNDKPSKRLSKGFKTSVYCNMNIKRKVIMKTRQMNLDIFSNQILLLFVLVYRSYGGNAKRFNYRKYYLPKGIIKNYGVIINGKTFYD